MAFSLRVVLNSDGARHDVRLTVAQTPPRLLFYFRLLSIILLGLRNRKGHILRNDDPSNGIQWIIHQSTLVNLADWSKITGKNEAL